MPYRLNLWGGELHTVECGGAEYEDWNKVSEVSQKFVDAGLMAVIIHTDFSANLSNEQEREFLQQMLDKL